MVYIIQIQIQGGRPLNGRVELSGAKNLGTKAMVAALLGDTPSEGVERTTKTQRTQRLIDPM